MFKNLSIYIPAAFSVISAMFFLYSSNYIFISLGFIFCVLFLGIAAFFINLKLFALALLVYAIFVIPVFWFVKSKNLYRKAEGKRVKTLIGSVLILFSVCVFIFITAQNISQPVFEEFDGFQFTPVEYLDEIASTLRFVVRKFSIETALSLGIVATAIIGFLLSLKHNSENQKEESID